MINNSSVQLKTRMLTLYNNILKTGIIPQKLKTALIIPIKKPRKPLDKIDSFRPISLLPCLSKLLEKIIAKRMLWYATTNNFISPNQVGFKPGSGTIDSLIH